jgi:hypothetical protein
MVGCDENIGIGKFGTESGIPQKSQPASFFKIAWKQYFESGEFNEHYQAQIVSRRKLRVRIPKLARRNTSHVLVERLTDCTGRAEVQQVPKGIAGKNSTLFFDFSEDVWTEGGVAKPERYIDTAIPQPLQIAHVILVRVRDK